VDNFVRVSVLCKSGDTYGNFLFTLFAQLIFVEAPYAIRCKRRVAQVFGRLLGICGSSFALFPQPVLVFTARLNSSSARSAILIGGRHPIGASIFIT
jgi:hypothetical protein